jgi:hypothetical protein
MLSSLAEPLYFTGFGCIRAKFRKKERAPPRCTVHSFCLISLQVLYSKIQKASADGMEDTSNQFAVFLGRATTDVLMYTRINQCCIDSKKKCLAGCFNKNKEKVSKTIIEFFSCFCENRFLSPKMGKPYYFWEVNFFS